MQIEDRVAPIFHLYTNQGRDRMAQVVGYFEDNVTYTEGPFVMVDASWIQPGSGWRVEVECPGYKCPVLPTREVYAVMAKLGYTGKTSDSEKVARIVDKLNELVRVGELKAPFQDYLE